MGVSSLWNILINPFYVSGIRYKQNLLQGLHEPIVRLDVFDKVVTELTSKRPR